jgi:hypothetical protein
MSPITLPGTIPGLICPGALVTFCGMSCRVIATLPDKPHMVALDIDFALIKDLALDLSDRVSRVAVAWWVIERGPVTDDEHVLLFTVKNGGHVNRKGQEQLRDMVLRRTQT